MSSSDSTMRRFKLNRKIDKTGVSGPGIVAEGIEWSNGRVALHWLTQLESVADYANMKTLLMLHGHDGATAVEWVDP